MDPKTPQQTPNTQVSASATNTFSSQVAKENTVSTEAFENNQSVMAAHRRGLLFRAMWIILIILLLASLAAAVYLTLRGRGGIGKTITAADKYNPTNLNVNGVNSSLLNGQLTVNGNQTNTGNLTVLGTINGVGDLNIGGNANIGGTLTATNLVGNIDAFNISGIIQPSQLDPFIAYTNKNFQLFFGNNQIFRNASNSTAGFQVQDSSASPILTVNTTSNYLVVNEAVASQSDLAFETAGNGRFAGTLQVGEQSNPNTSILNSGGLFSNDVQRVLTVQDISAPTVAVPDRIYTGTSAELLADPQISPVNITYCTAADNPICGVIPNIPHTVAGNKNIFAGGYSSVQTKENNPQDFYVVGGNLSSFAHDGSGNVLLGVGQFSSIGNLNTGSVSGALANVVAPSMSNGLITFYSGYTALDPQSSVLSSYGFPSLITGGTLLNQVGIDIQWQHSSLLPATNILSEGQYSNNQFEGALHIGGCSVTPVNIYEQVYLPFASRNNCANQLADQIKLKITGTASQTTDLTQWQDGTGTPLSVVTANGSLGVGTAAPSNRLTVVDTSSDTTASFTGTSGTCTVDTLGGSLSCVSDENLKTNILTINGGLDKIMELRGVTYNWKANPDTAAVSGFIAQEVEKVLPGLVSQLPNGTKSLNKDGIIPYLVNAIQDQQAQIDAIKNGSQVSGGVLNGGIVTDDIEFRGKATFNALTTFNGNVVFTNDATFNGTITGSVNNRGRSTVAAGATSNSVGIGAGHSGTPNVQLTPLTQIDGSYWVSGSGSNGFIIHLEKPQAGPVSFNWLVID